jgi:hypothetical protein
MKPLTILGHLRSATTVHRSQRPARRALGAALLMLALLLASLAPSGTALAAALCPNCFGTAETWSSYAYYGDRGTFFADVDGDRDVDAIVVNTGGVVVRPQEQQAGDVRTFGDHEVWSNYGFYGDRATYVADVNGDYKADLIAVYNNSPILVRLANSNTRTFEPAYLWTSNPFYGNRATAFADVTGDGWADAIVSNDETIPYGRIVVRRSMGGVFGINEEWTSAPFYGDRGTFFADVTGDGKADAIKVASAGIWVRPSLGHTFGAEVLWSDAFYGNRGTFFADVTGDGKADAIVSNDETIPFGRVVVRPSTGASFSALNQEWTDTPFYGTRGTFFVSATDMLGCWDRTADAIAVTDAGIVVRRSLAQPVDCIG